MGPPFGLNPPPAPLRGSFLDPLASPWVKRAPKKHMCWAPLETLVLGGPFRSPLVPLGRSSFQDVAWFGLPWEGSLGKESLPGAFQVLYPRENGPVTRSLLLWPFLAEAPVPLECSEVWKGPMSSGGEGDGSPFPPTSSLPSSPLSSPPLLPRPPLLIPLGARSPPRSPSRERCFLYAFDPA